METILERIRQERGLTYDKLRQLTGINSSGLLYRYCHGMQRIGAEHAVQISRCLGVSLSELRPDLWPPEGGQQTYRLSEKED